MSTFAKMCHVIPIHTADAERTVSQLKLIKTRIRNRLSEGILDSLLRIVVEGSSPQDYPIQEAVKLWAKKKKQTVTIISTYTRPLYNISELTELYYTIFLLLTMTFASLFSIWLHFC